MKEYVLLGGSTWNCSVRVTVRIIACVLKRCFKDLTLLSFALYQQVPRDSNLNNAVTPSTIHNAWVVTYLQLFLLFFTELTAHIWV